ncbi:serine/threonine-protein kinase [Catenulispora pinisilvae]|uniref:serine/threonine-protein kinase n=1 Tax=Catenulispora pinisilvae TaxID=2705253 RepID=UPI001890FA27|nr:serine/threonine-protein kinase [Catenulispora pinisilvae]
MTMQTLGAGDPHRIGPYVLTGRLGAGGMGSVYLGWDPAGRPAAVKVVRNDFLQDPDFRARFRREISSARRVSGPWISRVLDADPDAESPWLATEYVAGPTLDAAVNRFGPLPTETVAVLAQCLGQALEAVHAAGVVHRDIKPNNILLAADGPRIIDFGIARATDDTKLTATHAGVLGVAGFIAPERIERQAMLPAGDVFAGGVVLAFAATGKLAFGSGEPVTVAYRVVHAEPDLAELPEELRPLVAQCLAKDPAARPDAVQMAGEAARLRGASDWPGVPMSLTDWSGGTTTGDTLELATSWLPKPLAMHTVRDYDLTAAHAAAETARLNVHNDPRFAAAAAGAGASAGSGPGGAATPSGPGGPAGVGGPGGPGVSGGPGVPGGPGGSGGAAGFGVDFGPGANAGAGGLTGAAHNAAGFGDMSGRDGSGGSGGPGGPGGPYAPHGQRPPRRSGDTEQLPERRKKPALLIGGAAAAVVAVAVGVIAFASGGSKSNSTAQGNGANAAASQSVSGKDGGDLPGGAASKPGDVLPTSGGAPPAGSSTSSASGSAPAQGGPTGQGQSSSSAQHTSAASSSAPASHTTSPPPPPSHSSVVVPPSTSQQAPAPAAVPCSGTKSTSQGTGIYCGFDPAGNGSTGGSPVVSGGTTVGYLPQGSNWVICQAQGSTVTQGQYYNSWWAWTEANDSKWGWVNAVNAHGGDNNGAYGNVPMCNGSHGSAP